LQERLAKLVGGVAVIKVGAATETEMKEKKARIGPPSWRAWRPRHRPRGRHRALLRASKALVGLTLSGDQQIGVTIVARAIEEPLRWIANNAGQEGSIVVARVKDMGPEEGFNGYAGLKAAHV
jgi:chaperonin GroEL